MIIPTIEPLWTVEDVSAFLGVPVTTLYQWRYRRTGPRATEQYKDTGAVPYVLRSPEQIAGFSTAWSWSILGWYRSRAGGRTPRSRRAICPRRRGAQTLMRA